MTNVVNGEIQLDAPSQGGPPGIKFPQVGQSVKVGIVDVVDYQQRTMSGELKTFDDGNPKMGKRVIGVVMQNNGGMIKDPENEDQEILASEGDLVSFFCEGSRFFTWKEALKEHGKVVVGDVMVWKFDRTEKAANKGFNDRKVFTANIQTAGLADGPIKNICVEQYMKLHGINDVTADEANAGDAIDGNSAYEM